MTKEEYTKKYLEGTLSDTEMEAFESLEEYKSITRLLNAVQAFKAPNYNINEELEQFSCNIKHKRKIGSVHKFWKPIGGVAAAILIIIAFGYMQYNNSDNNSEILFADKTEFNLPDSSFVSLNKGSKLYYTKKGWQDERSVELKGEAFFKVRKGSKFEVATELGRVSVLGTEFNVKSWENYFEVACYSGLVQVKTPQSSVQLTKNSVFRLINGIPNQMEILNDDAPSWLRGESKFRSVPLSVVLQEFARQYQVNVITDKINLPESFTGSFTHKDMNLALESITLPSNLSYKIKGNQVIFRVESK